MMNWLKDVVFTITHPSFWFMNYPYSAAWDAELRQLLSTTVFTDVTEYTAKLGGIRIWVANYPFACMNFMGNRPSRRLIAKAYQRLLRAAVAEARLKEKTP